MKKLTKMNRVVFLMKRIILFIAILFFVVSCDTDCSDEKQDVRNKYGIPEEVNTYSSGDYHSDSWWYWSKGVEYTFTWSNSESCDVSKYTFTPLEKPVSSEMRLKIEETKVLEYRKCKCENNIIF